MFADIKRKSSMEIDNIDTLHADLNLENQCQMYHSQIYIQADLSFRSIFDDSINDKQHYLQILYFASLSSAKIAK